MSKREQILSALFERLKGLDITVKRNELAPQAIPKNGILILRDGTVGEPTVLLSPPHYIYQHKAEIEVLVQLTKPADRDSLLDKILMGVGKLLKIDPTLSGTIDYMHAGSPEFVEELVEGGMTIKGAIIPIILEYITGSSLT